MSKSIKLTINHFDDLEEKLRRPRQRLRMKVSGMSVKKIAHIIRQKSSIKK